MSNNHDAQAKANRKSNQGDGAGRPERVGKIQLNGTVLRAEPIGTTEENHQWGNSPRESDSEGSNDYGKILERLDALEKDFLEYVDAHQARLNARLEESKDKKIKFAKEASEIRSSIYDLIATQNNSNNGNS